MSPRVVAAPSLATPELQYERGAGLGRSIVRDTAKDTFAAMTAGPVLPTLLLDQGAWDLCVDAAGNLAVAQPPYATAQDVSSAIRTFLGECWYQTDLGVQYQGILGKNPSLSFVRAQMEAAALSVPGVISAVCTLQAVSNRQVTGQVQFTDSGGTTQTIPIG